LTFFFRESRCSTSTSQILTQEITLKLQAEWQLQIPHVLDVSIRQRYRSKALRVCKIWFDYSNMTCMLLTPPRSELYYTGEKAHRVQNSRKKRARWQT
jgi:hypothetical protein